MKEEPFEPSIHQLLDLSTAHLPERLGRESDSRKLSNVPGIVAYDLEYGFLMLVPQPGDADPLPLELQPVVEYARRHGCTWIKFDADGTMDDNLPAYDW